MAPASSGRVPPGRACLLHGIGPVGVAIALFLATGCLAETTDAAGRLVYAATFFAPFSPTSALEIVERVPGFRLDVGNTDVRGFGQAAGNVVINGQRPSSKSDTLDTILARIPAKRVLRVEVSAGEAFGSDYAGKAQVLNLVLSAEAGVSGTAEAGVRRDFTGQLLPLGSASAQLKRGRSTFTGSASLSNNASSEQGYDRLSSLPDGASIEYRSKVNHIREPIRTASASWAYDGGTNRTANINAQASLDRFRLTQNNDVIPTSGAVRDDLLTQRYRTQSFEVGGDVTRPVLDGGLKLVGLITRRKRLNQDLSLNRILSAVTGGSGQTLQDTREESVARLSWNRPKLLGWTVELGVEGALNRLESDVNLFGIDPAGRQTRFDLPIDHAIVKETRGEAFVNAGRALTKTLRLDLGMTYEASRLTVSGDAQAERVLSFPKPKVVLDWQPKGGWHAQLSIQRTVAQLQFEDFISTAQLSSGQVNGGNADLQPQRAWEGLASVEHPILGDGLIRVEAGATFVSKVQDRIPIAGGLDAPGNLGSGHEIIARARIDTPLAKLGVKGGRLTLYGSYVQTSVRDPYTLEDRPFSNNAAFYYQVTFRQDLGKFAWGLDLQQGTQSTSYRRNELDRSSRNSPYASLFVEYRPSKRTTISLKIDNLIESGGFRRRTFFTPDRSSAAPFLFEIRRRNQHMIPLLRIKRSFD